MRITQINLLALVLLAQLTSSLTLHLTAVNSALPQADLLKYMNEARTNPKAFAQYVKTEITQFLDDRTLPLSPGVNYATNEGIGAWKEAQQFLLNQTPLEPMYLNEGLSLAAEDHAIDMAVTGIFGHDSSDGKSFMDRITKRCGKAFGGAGQNIGSEFKVSGRNHALQTIMGLIIDDGVANRGHRANIFSTTFKYVGIASRVRQNKILTVFDFHTSNLPTIDSTPNTNNAGAVIDQPSNQNSNPNPSGGSQPAPPTPSRQPTPSPPTPSPSPPSPSDSNGSSGFSTPSDNNKYPVRISTRTRRSTRNGVTTAVKTVTTLYSDGSQEVQTTTTTQ